MATVFTVFAVTEPGIEAMTCQSQGGHYATGPLSRCSIVKNQVA